MLLVFELGSSFVVRVITYQLIPVEAIVILTIRSGLRDCAPVSPLIRSRCSSSIPVCSDNPLLRAVYRDGEALTNTLSPRTP